MNLVRTSIAVASVCAVLGWSAESLAQSGTADTDTGKQDQTNKKTTKTTKTTTNTTKKNTDSSASGTGSGTSGSTTSGSTTSGTSGTSGTAPSSPPTPSPSDTSGSGTTGTTGTGSGMTGGTGIPSGTDTSGMGTGTMGTGTSPYDTSGTTYPLGTQPGATSQGAYGTQGAYGQPGTSNSQTATSTTQTTSAMYDPTVTADREAGKYNVRPNRPLLVTGAAIFLGSYAATAIQGAVSPLDADRKNLIPVAGPWINMSERPCNLSNNCSTGENVNNVLLIGSGVAQGAGIAIALISLAVPETHERAMSTAKAAPPKPSFRVVPAQMGRGGAGAFAMGTF